MQVSQEAVSADTSASEIESESQKGIRPSEPILEAFESGRFSDILVRFQRNEFRLHRVLLSRSSYFNNLLKEDTKEIEIELKGTLIGFKLALKEYYDFDRLRTGITIDNAFETLYWAIKLESQDLCGFIGNLISSHLFRPLILIRLERVDCVGLELIKLKKKGDDISMHNIFQSLQASYLSTLFYCLGLCDTDEETLRVKEEFEIQPLPATAKASILESSDIEFRRTDSIDARIDIPTAGESKIKFQLPSISSNLKKSEFLAQLPYFWIQKVIRSDCLCVKDEFERYQLAKRVLELNGTVTFPSTITIENPRKRKMNEIEIECSSAEDLDSMESGCTVIENDSCLITDKTDNIFESAIIYTYMSFANLDIVKQDGLVPLNLALESYWLQNELTTNAKSNKKCPKFRFSYKFTNISTESANLLSPTFNCLSQLFRIMLSTEDGGYKALLQKSKGGSPITYCIYKLDLRGGQIDGSDSPVTYCTADDDGYANLIENREVLENGEDSFWLIACIRFNK